MVSLTTSFLSEWSQSEDGVANYCKQALAVLKSGMERVSSTGSTSEIHRELKPIY